MIELTMQEADILAALHREPFVNQRVLAQTSGHSLGIVNRCLRTLTAAGYLDDRCQLTAAAGELLRDRTPKNAVILAAGFGMRMVPINVSTSKGLLEVGGEPLIERQIKQLREAGIRDIAVVVGFLKEQYEYLIDAYGVELIVNPQYARRNNLYSLALAAGRLSDTYIVPCDIWCGKNPFRTTELYSWYMVSDRTDAGSDVRLNRKKELVRVDGDRPGNGMIGIAYLTGSKAAAVRERLEQMVREPRYDGAFWEEALYQNDRMFVQARVVSGTDAVEIDTYEQLRELDTGSGHLRSDALSAIAGVFNTTTDRITDIQVLKKGMTNRSFSFRVKGEKYIMRIPGEGTDRLIDRRQEAAVFRAISGLGLCDDPVYIDPDSGYKITRFLPGIRTCDPDSVPDLKRAMEKLADFHRMRLTVPHTFDLFGQIAFYQSLWQGRSSAYRDHGTTTEHVLSLRPYIEKTRTAWCLTHIDAVPDNFLFYDTPEGEMLQLTDWEYAGMQDPHVDIAMFCVYSLYGREQVDRLIDLYFAASGEPCTAAVRAKIYAYIAVCGLLWSNWCEFKSILGVEFGEYSLRQYRFAKDYYRYALEEMKKAEPDGTAG